MASQPPIAWVALMKAMSPASSSGHSNYGSVAKSNAVVYNCKEKIPLPHSGLGLWSKGTLQ
jgi:hypothetical protein